MASTSPEVTQAPQELAQRVVKKKPYPFWLGGAIESYQCLAVANLVPAQDWRLRLLHLSLSGSRSAWCSTLVPAQDRRR